MVLKEERDFYERYRWTLLPFLSFGQIREKLHALVREDLASIPEWCRKEWNINLYLLASAAADITDDFLTRGVYNFSKLSDYISVLNRPVKLLRGITISASRVRGHLKDKELRRWRELWSESLISLCNPLVADEIPSLDEQQKARDTVSFLLDFTFQKDLMLMRTRIPAAYRSQDLSHHDFVSLTKEYSLRHTAHDCPQVVIGLRSAGSYIAPIICACLRSEGYADVSYLTIRPKSFIHPWDEERLRKVSGRKAHFIVVDEPPNTGKTIARSLEILRKFGVNSEAITIMVPIHPAKREWLDLSLKSALGHTEIISLDPEEWYKAKLFAPDAICESIRPYFETLGIWDIEVKETAQIRQINDRLDQNQDKAFHVRLKRVFHVVPKNPGSPQGFLVMAKSVGWGWLGYHAALAASALSPFVPRVFGVRNGIMYLDWVEKPEKIIVHGQKENETIAKKVAAYISLRTNRMRLAENPMPFLSSYRDGGLQAIALILSKAFGPKVSKLKRGWVREQLENLVCPVPAMIDSRMMRGEWIESADGLVKTDFEHHGFSKTASHNIVDPAYDIASALLAFELSQREGEELVQTYIQETADASIDSRLIYYQLLSGNEAMTESLEKLISMEHYPRYQELNRQYIRSWNFMVNATAQHSALFCEGQPVKRWATPMFVMDIDDVLDKNIFGFPSTTANGVRALSLLRAHGICSIINTARSIDEVKEYCKYYGFPGGIAEYGSAIWDDVEQRAEILVTSAALGELAALRDDLSKVPGVFVNPFYQYSIRAYCFEKQRTIPVPEATIGELFSRLEIKELTARRSYIDTAIIARSVDKGQALLRVRLQKKLNDDVIGAIGDTEADLPMLMAADKGFLVANSTGELKRKARPFGISITPSSFQSGLLDGVRRFLHGNGKPCKDCGYILEKLDQNSDPFWRILNIADMSTLQHWVRAFDRNIMKTFKE